MAEARDLQESVSLTSGLPSHDESPNASRNTEKRDDVSYGTLNRVPYTLVLTICYVTLAVVTWILTCVLMHRPISAKSYDIHISDGSKLHDSGLYREIETGFSKTKGYLRAVKVLGSITSVVTIPMSSAVCSSDPKLRDITSQLQKRLSATSLDTPQFRLWSRNQTTNYKSRLSDQNIEIQGLYETNNQSTFRILSWLNDPFWAHPPSRLNTGVFQQFVSRVDFKVNFAVISQAEFPETCNEPNNLAIHQSDQYESEDTAYALDLCMSKPDQGWKQHLAKQDIVEELFMRINITGRPIIGRYGEPGVYYTRTTVRTTTGYFELPNYANKQFPGPLLSDGPNPHCSRQCRNQGWGESFLKPNLSSESLWLRQRAPLYATTMAVFGNGSVFDKDYTKLWGLASAIPMCALLLQDDADPRRECESHRFGLDAKNKEIAAIEANTDRVDAARSFLSLFTAAQDSSATATSIERAFTAAAMLFIDEWHEQGHYQDFEIARSLGMDLQIPHMAKSGIILVSTLLGVFLSCLLGLAIYTAITPRWTAQLDSFAMMRIGASITPQLPFRLCRDADELELLDALPGWVGHGQNSTDQEPGGLSLGGTTGLSSKKRYAFYHRRHGVVKLRGQRNRLR